MPIQRLQVCPETKVRPKQDRKRSRYENEPSLLV